MLYIVIYAPPIVLVLLVLVGITSLRQHRLPNPALVVVALICGLSFFGLVALACHEGTSADSQRCTTTNTFLDPLLLTYLGVVLASVLPGLLLPSHRLAHRARHQLISLAFWSAVLIPLALLIFELV